MEVQRQSCRWEIDVLFNGYSVVRNPESHRAEEERDEEYEHVGVLGRTEIIHLK